MMQMMLAAIAAATGSVLHSEVTHRHRTYCHDKNVRRGLQEIMMRTLTHFVHFIDMAMYSFVTRLFIRGKEQYDEQH